MAAYQSGSHIDSTAIDIGCTLCGIAFMLINVRVGLGWAHEAHSQLCSDPSIRTSAQQCAEQLDTVCPVEVNFTYVVRQERDVETPETPVKESLRSEPCTQP